MQPMIFCDTHVHIYDCFNLDNFLSKAWSNFNYAALSCKKKDACYYPALLLTESTKYYWFARLRDGNLFSRRWSFQRTDETNSIIATSNEGHKLIIINGRQIVTSEDLEVLALATSKILPDGKPIEHVVEWVLMNDGIPVIPWGFGKWWGARGKVLSNLLNWVPVNDLFLGDNSGRPWFLRRPNHFAIANREKRRILPGSDPLPFPTEEWRPGSVGLYFDGYLEYSAPAESIRNSLKDPNTVVGTYMHCERFIPFIRNQIRMQIKKGF